MRPRLDRCDIRDQRDSDDMAEPTEAAEPMDPIEAIEPMLPIDITEPTLPIDRTDPLDPIDNTESSDHSDQRDEPVERAGMRQSCPAERRVTIGTSGHSKQLGNEAGGAGGAVARHGHIIDGR